MMGVAAGRGRGYIGNARGRGGQPVDARVSKTRSFWECGFKSSPPAP